VLTHGGVGGLAPPLLRLLRTRRRSCGWDSPEERRRVNPRGWDYIAGETGLGFTCEWASGDPTVQDGAIIIR
jgi:hypothetical protein